MQNIIGIYMTLRDGEVLEMENPSTTFINFEKSSFFKKKYDTCFGKIYLTNQRLVILKIIQLEAKNMRIESADQFGATLGQWFDIDLQYVTNLSTINKSFFSYIYTRLTGWQTKEGLELHYESPMETEKKSLFGGSKMVREKFVVVFSVDDKDLWNMKLQTAVGRAKS